MNSCGADLIPHHFAVEVETRSTVAIFTGLMVKCVVWPTIDDTMTTRKYFHPRQYCGFSSLPSPHYLLPQCVCVLAFAAGWLRFGAMCVLRPFLGIFVCEVPR